MAFSGTGLSLDSCVRCMTEKPDKSPRSPERCCCKKISRDKLDAGELSVNGAFNHWLVSQHLPRVRLRVLLVLLTIDADMVLLQKVYSNSAS